MTQKFIDSLMNRPNFPLTQEDIKVVKDYLIQEGWKHEKNLDSNCFSHQDIEKGWPIFDWPEALIQNTLMKAKKGMVNA